MSCCPNVLYFARGNGIPLPSVKRYLGLCSKNMSNELHSNDDFNDLKLITSNDARKILKILDNIISYNQ